MNEKTCDCPHCNCKLGSNPIVSAGKSYCCQACADHHRNGEPCTSTAAGCQCSKAAHD
ncbi:metallothionein [Pseudomonas gingeri]|uniref:Metallothionein n=1 Tax=Pseudomonas gingeri TaxID=117681 RepID=A0A7Y7Y740_9PSED|nr:metallothionein [Pseudomonas gingeri]NWA05270.1 metallothionein [Pseudomonas gingeri]NWA15067.1 metallothionein [Pseudomonas gingeri]NWA55768.1 metallothionein [Pseudomonas gingeri]NWA98521.1 metallothionein [Pseudomonas gingeri]NWB02838.1 metallothionein [Pseudomonas gingeri]